MRSAIKVDVVSETTSSDVGSCCVIYDEEDQLIVVRRRVGDVTLYEETSRQESIWNSFRCVA